MVYRNLVLTEQECEEGESYDVDDLGTGDRNYSDKGIEMMIAMIMIVTLRIINLVMLESTAMRIAIKKA